VIGPNEVRRIQAPDTPPAGIFGAGLFRRGRDDSYVPALFVMQELVGVRPTNSIDVVRQPSTAPAVSLLGSIGLEPPPGGVVVSMPVPHELATKIHCDMFGTLGVPVWLADARQGVLTAGHVAQAIGAQPTVNGNVIGVVVHSNHRRLHQFPDSSADVAAIALNEMGLKLEQVPPFHAVGSAEKLHKAWAFNCSGTGSNGELVRSVHQTFAVDEMGQWEDVATVDAAISIDGDSGAAVIDDQGNLIGQIVGGHPMAYSLVQNIDLLLGDSDARVRQ